MITMDQYRHHLKTLLKSGAADGREDIRNILLRRVEVLVVALAEHDAKMNRNGDKFGVKCVRLASPVAGPVEHWLKQDGAPLLFDTLTEAEQRALQLRSDRSSRSTQYLACQWP